MPQNNTIKILRILFICFIVIYPAAIAYFDWYLKVQSVYWLFCMLGGLAIMLIGVLFNLGNNKTDTKTDSVVRKCFYLVFAVFYGYRGIAEYNRNICQDKFGLVFNKTRKTLGVPQIPADWHIETRGNRSVDWAARDSTLGHESKTIFIDSICRIELERDEYNLKPLNGVTRYMSITTHYYARGKSADSIFYYYEEGDDNRLISKQRADSIFAKEKIKKDY